MMNLVELYQIADKNNIVIDNFPMRAIIGLSIPGSIAIDYKKIKSSVMEKECLAHELGHCLTGSFYNEYSPLDLKEKHELRAERWEIENLVPYPEFKTAVHNGLQEVWQLADYFNVSENFMKKTIDYYKNNKNIDEP